MPGTPNCFTVAELISALDACAGFSQYAQLRVCGDTIFWLASHPETGSVALWQADHSGICQVNIGPGSIRSRLNGYGGGAYAVLPGRVIWVADDQRVWQLDRITGKRTLLVPDDDNTWGGLVADPQRDRVLAVREQRDHQALLALEATGQVRVLHQGLDFYGAPTVSQDGTRVAWCSWQLPDMPWLQSTLWQATVTADGNIEGASGQSPPVSGSVQQPQFAGEHLWVISDHEGWWQPWQVTRQGGHDQWLKSTAPMLDHANAPWQLGERHSCPLREGGWARVQYCQGIGELWLERAGQCQRVAEGWTDFRDLSPSVDGLVCIGRAADRHDAVLKVCADSGSVTVLAGGQMPDRSTMAPMAPVAFVVDAEAPDSPPVQGFLYPPALAPAAAPPVILIAHGGPTSAAYAVYNPQVQFWCQRGFAVAEVNYSGSTGAGRDFRLRLAGRWGEADVQDMVRCADYLATQGLVCANNVFIQGRSSGGYTALMAAVQTDRFKAVGSLFGVTDPWRLRAETHRFESGYLDWLLGDPQLHHARWQARTPSLHAGLISGPAIFFQGMRDAVVVPDQTRRMVAALRAQGQPVELHCYEDEGHGFQKADNQAHMLESLYRFYGNLASNGSQIRQKDNEPAHKLS
ncbi:prolyl oligopeptidase family serine peptidase [Marinobacter sp. NSM]|uniref:prolyl oligopeptidase family serine peptidase n=1 Tax=Marinobacter sp. NSM TaxID=3458004 RepID=UPI004035F961